MLILLDAWANPTPRYGGGKLIAAYMTDDKGKLRRVMNEYLEQRDKEEQEMIEAILAYWSAKE
jgi:hypothetical protein